MNVVPENDGDFTCTLNLESMTLGDNGQVTAVAVNSEGEDRTTARLSVMG